MAHCTSHLAWQADSLSPSRSSTTIMKDEKDFQVDQNRDRFPAWIETGLEHFTLLKGIVQGDHMIGKWQLSRFNLQDGCLVTWPPNVPQ